MHTIQTVIPTAVRPTTGPTTGHGRTGSTGRRTARLLSAWAERHLLGAPDARQVPATPHRQLPLPWS